MKNPNIDPGNFRHRLRLERQNEVPDGSGGFITDWQLVGELWAAMEPVANTRQIEVGTFNAQISHKITIRWRGDCRPQMRFTKTGRAFLINSIVDPDETRRYLNCTCEEVT